MSAHFCTSCCCYAMHYECGKPVSKQINKYINIYTDNASDDKGNRTLIPKSLAYAEGDKMRKMATRKTEELTDRTSYPHPPPCKIIKGLLYKSPNHVMKQRQTILETLKLLQSSTDCQVQNPLITKGTVQLHFNSLSVKNVERQLHIQQPT